MPTKRFPKKAFFLTAFFFLITLQLPPWTFGKDANKVSLDDLRQQISQLDVTIAHLVEQKKEIAAEIEQLKENSIQKTTPTWRDPLLGIDFVWIPPGCFHMGDRLNSGDQDERPAHKVCLDGFYMSKFEITQAQYVKIMRKNPSHIKSLHGYPVESVSWQGANIFASRYSKISEKKMRLPSEAEWEYAARAGDTRYKYAGSDNPNEVAWSRFNNASIVHKVGLKQPNDFGLYDMSGNVSEWCADWYASDYYADSSFNNPQGPGSGNHKVFRGGNYQSILSQLRVADRRNAAPHIKLPFIGFRIAFTP